MSPVKRMHHLSNSWILGQLYACAFPGSLCFFGAIGTVVLTADSLFHLLAEAGIVTCLTRRDILLGCCHSKSITAACTLLCCHMIPQASIPGPSVGL